MTTSYFTVVSFFILSRSLIVNSAAFAVPPIIQSSQRRTSLSDSRHDIIIKGQRNIQRRGGSVRKSVGHNLAMLPPDMDLLLTTNQLSATQYNDAIFTLSSSSFSLPSSLLSSAVEQSQSPMSKLIQMMHYFYDCILAVTGIGILNGIFLNRQKEKLGFIEGEEKYLNLKSAMPGAEDYAALQKSTPNKGLFSVLSPTTTSSTDSPSTQVMADFENKLLPPAKGTWSKDPDSTSTSSLQVDDDSHHNGGTVSPTAVVGDRGGLVAMFRQELERRKTIMPMPSLDYVTPLQKSFPVTQQSDNNSTADLGDDDFATKATNDWNEDEPVEKIDSSASINSNENVTESISNLGETLSDVQSTEHGELCLPPQGDDTIQSRRTNSILNFDLSIKETIEEISKERDMNGSILLKDDLLDWTFPTTNVDTSKEWDASNDDVVQLPLENIMQMDNESISNEETNSIEYGDESIVPNSVAEMTTDMSSSQDNQGNDPMSYNETSKDRHVGDESSALNEVRNVSFQPSQSIQDDDDDFNGTNTILGNEVQSLEESKVQSLEESEVQSLEEISSTNMPKAARNYDNQEYNDTDYTQEESVNDPSNQESNIPQDPIPSTMPADDFQYSSFDDSTPYDNGDDEYDDDINDNEYDESSMSHPFSSSSSSIPPDQNTSWTEISTPDHVSEDDFKMAQGLAKAAFHAELKKQSTQEQKRIDSSDYKTQVENDMRLVREYAKQKNILKDVARAQGGDQQTSPSELLKRLAEIERRRKFESIGLIDPRLYGSKKTNYGISSTTKGQYERPFRVKDEIQEEEELADEMVMEDHQEEDQDIREEVEEEQDSQQQDDNLQNEIKTLEASLSQQKSTGKTTILSLAKRRRVVFVAAAIVIGRRLVSLWFGGGLMF